MEIQAEDTALDTPVIVPRDDEPALILPTPRVKKRKKTRFWKGLSVYAVLLIAVVAVGLWFFYSFLEKYEAATPNAALERYLTWVSMEDYESIYESSGFEESHLNTKEQYIHYFKNLYDNADDLSLREQVTTDDSVHRYSLYSGKEKLSNIVLARDPEGDGSSWYVSTELQYQEPFTVIASGDVRLSVNGTEINLLQLKATEIQKSVFPTVEDAEITLPVIQQYTIEGLLNPPTVTALTLGGEECIVKQDGQTIPVFAPATDTQQKELEDLAIEAATTYARFVARDASRTTLLEYVHKDSELYQTIRNFSNVWFNTHEGYDFHDIAVSAFNRYSSDDFTCIVSFQPTYLFEGETVTAAPVNYRMTFLYTEDAWMLYSLTQTTANNKDGDTTTTTSSETETTTTATDN